MVSWLSAEHSGFMMDSGMTDKRRLLEKDGDNSKSYGTKEVKDITEHNRMLYPIDKAPSPFLLPVFGLQYMLLAIPNILVGAVLLSNQLEAGAGVRSELFSLGLFTTGVSSLIQILAGSRLPIIDGSNSVYIVAIAAIMKSSNIKNDTSLNSTLPNTTDSSVEPWKFKIAELQGNLLLASATHFMLAVTGITGFLLRFIGPVTLAPTILLLGVSLSEYMIPLCEQHWGIATLSAALVVIFSLMLAKVNVPVPVIKMNNNNKLSLIRYPLFQLNAVILAVGLSWSFCYILTLSDVLPRNSTMYGHKARTDVRNDFHTTPWFYLPRMFSFGMPTLTVSGYVGMLSVNLITIMELMGGFFATATVTDTESPPMHAVNRGLAMSGLSCAICSVFGNVLGNAPYLHLLGCISVTKIASRTVFLATACMLVLVGVVGKIGAALTLIPDPVIGGVNLVTYAMLSSVGISLFHHVDLSSTRNLMIIGLCLVLGLKVPAWMVRNQDLIKTGNDEVDQVLIVMLSTPMCITGLLGSLLDNITPGTAEERGISKWRHRADGSTENHMTGGHIYEFPYINKLLVKLKCCVYCPISQTFDNNESCLSCRSVSTSEDKADQTRDETG